MKRILAVVCVVSALATAGTVLAQTLPAPTWVFTTIDAVRRNHETQLILTGVLDGAPGPSDAQLDGYTSTSGYQMEALNACERYAMVMMSKPGQYKLEAWRRGVLNSQTAVCRLTKQNP